MGSVLGSKDKTNGKQLKFSFMPQCRSGELAPNGMRALWKQRLRWAEGWDEVTLKHWGGILKAKLSLRLRMGLVYIFILRWFTLPFAFLIVVINSLVSLLALCQISIAEVPTMATHLQYASFIQYMFIVATGFYMAVLYEFRPHLIVGLIVYFLFNWAALALMAAAIFMSLARVTTGNRGGWGDFQVWFSTEFAQRSIQSTTCPR